MHDDRIRNAEGVVASAVRVGDNRVRIVFDDVAGKSSEWPYEWKTRVLFTCLECDADTFMNASFTERQLADIGLTLVARLAAIAKSPGL